MKNADMPAMPVEGEFLVDPTNTKLGTENYHGLTKLEMISMHLMAAWVQHHGSSLTYGFSKEGAARDAVECANALLAELERTK